MSTYVCPACGGWLDHANAVRWHRLLVSPDIRPVAPASVPIADFGTRINYFCPSCRVPQNYPLDAPLDAA
jgi:hypothetical protein